MRIVFTGGGTGGHVFPNVAIIDELKKRASAQNPLDLFYIGAKNSIEEKIMREEGIAFFGIHAGKLRRYFDMKNFVDIFKVPLGIMQAYRILKKIKPQLVFAKGGYVSLPVVLAARMLRISVWIHESDVTPGLGTKICSRVASKIWLSFEESKQYFHPRKIEVVGNPIRAKMLRGSAHEGYKLTGFSKDRPVILVIGGSIGAQSLNKIIFEVLAELTKHSQVIHLTGPASITSYRPTVLHSYRSFPFLNQELADCYAISDLVISRAGSGTIFEVLALGKPLLLIPLPKSVSRGDQIENAHIFEHHGWARYLYQDAITSKDFLREILEMLKPRKTSQQSSPLTASAMKIADEILIALAQSQQKPQTKASSKFPQRNG